MSYFYHFLSGKYKLSPKQIEGGGGGLSEETFNPFYLDPCTRIYCTQPFFYIGIIESRHLRQFRFKYTAYYTKWNLLENYCRPYCLFGQNLDSLQPHQNKEGMISIKQQHI